MGWQKTFTLSRRAKGCHLVTDEVVRNIRDGLKDVKVASFALRIDLQTDLLNVLAMLRPNLLGGDVIPIHVRCSSGAARDTMWHD